MGLSSYIDEIIEQNHGNIVSDIPFKDILIDLRSAHILSTAEVNRLRKSQDDKDAGFEFLEILKSRNDQNFFQFCNILKGSDIENVQNIGLKLEDAANKKIPFHGKNQTNILEPVKNLQVSEGFTSDLAAWPGRLLSSLANWISSDSKEHLLRDLPPTPESSYILRKQFSNAICYQLKQINRSPSGGRILVHGMPGCGKTITVCQSVRQVIMQEYCFQSYGCHWIKIGDISDQDLLCILRGLATNLGIANTETIMSLVEVNAKINRFLQDKRQSKKLFVFDDIWNEDHLNFITFAKTSICTSRFHLVTNDYDFIRIKASERLTHDEAIQLIQRRRHNDITYILQDNKLVKDIIRGCGGLPIAIAIIAGLNLKCDEDWQNVIKMIITPKSEFKTSDYRTNVFQTFELSIKQLSPERETLFRLLGVFKATKISLQSIVSLWQVHPLQAKLILEELHSKSLLTFVDGNSVLHDLIIEHLQQPIDHRQSFQQHFITLNKMLIDGYCKQCQGKWFRHPHDDYYYQHVIYHAIQAQDHNTIQNIISDFKWMNNKLQLDNTIFNLCVDMEKAINYLRTNKIENWQQYQQLVELLKRNECNLPIKSIDLVQVLLTLAYDTDWIRERALELAKENKNDNQYWTITMINLETAKGTVDPLKSKRIGKTYGDYCIALSNPLYKNLRIVGSEYNSSEDCRIVLMDYETSKIVYQLSLHRRRISNIAISPDGRVIAVKSDFEQTSIFQMWEVLQFLLVGSWNVYDVDSNKELYFMENTLLKLRAIGDFDQLKFSPVMHDNDNILATLSMGRRQIKVWRIVGNSIHDMNKQISIDYDIESIEWIQNGNQILLWWRKNNDTSFYFKLLYWSKWINECQIEIWDLQSWQCLKSLRVPAYITRRENQYSPAITANDGRLLVNVKYINCTIECLVLSYQTKGGLLKLQNYDLKLWYDEHALEKNFYPFPSDIYHRFYDRTHIAVSDDQQFIFIGGPTKIIYAFKVANGELQSSIMLNSSYGKLRSMFALENNRLLTHNMTNSICEYVIQGDSLQWNILNNDDNNEDSNNNDKSNGGNNNEDDDNGVNYNEKDVNDDDDNNNDKSHNEVEVLDSSYTYMSNDPVAVQLIKKDETYKLKFYNLQQQSCPPQFHHTSKEQVNKCYILDDLKSAIIIRINPENVIITQCQWIDLISQNDDTRQHKILWQYKLPNDVRTISIKKLRYRVIDDTLIIVMDEYIKDEDGARLALVTITLWNGQTIIYTDKDLYDYSQCVYMNDYCLIAGFTYVGTCFVTCYQIGNDTIQTRKITMQKYSLYTSATAIAWKITLSANQSAKDLQFKSSLLNFDKYRLGSGFFLMIDVGNGFMILDKWSKVRIIGNNQHFKSIDHIISIVIKEILWCHKYYVGINEFTKNIHIYDVATTQLLHILPFRYFDINGIKWNQEQSSFIAYDDSGQHCVIKRVQLDDIDE